MKYSRIRTVSKRLRSVIVLGFSPRARQSPDELFAVWPSAPEGSSLLRTLDERALGETPYPGLFTRVPGFTFKVQALRNSHLFVEVVPDAESQQLFKVKLAARAKAPSWPATNISNAALRVSRELIARNYYFADEPVHKLSGRDTTTVYNPSTADVAGRSGASPLAADLLVCLPARPELPPNGPAAVEDTEGLCFEFKRESFSYRDFSSILVCCGSTQAIPLRLDWLVELLRQVKPSWDDTLAQNMAKLLGLPPELSQKDWDALTRALGEAAGHPTLRDQISALTKVRV